MLRVLQVQRLNEKELALLDITLSWSLDEFLAAVVVEEMLDGPAVSATIHGAMYREFNEAIQAIREGAL